MSLAERQQMLRKIAASLGLDFDEVFRDGRFAFLSAEQIRQLARSGVDIELHTHTHRLPHDRFDAMRSEVTQNQAALKDVLGTDARHFCYPSGEYRPMHPQWLERLGILSAVTCDPGLNGPRASPMLLRRYLDSELTEDIVFEAEVCGLRDLLRDLRFRSRRLPAGSPPEPLE